MHGLADQVLPQHRANRSAAISGTAGKRGASAALEVDIPQTLGGFYLAQENGSAVTEPRIELPELMARVALGDRMSGLRELLTHEEAQAILTAQPRGIHTELLCEGIVEDEEGGVGKRSGRPRRAHTRQSIGETGQ